MVRMVDPKAGTRRKRYATAFDKLQGVSGSEYHDNGMFSVIGKQSSH